MFRDFTGHCRVTTNLAERFRLVNEDHHGAGAVQAVPGQCWMVWTVYLDCRTDATQIFHAFNERLPHCVQNLAAVLDPLLGQGIGIPDKVEAGLGTGLSHAPSVDGVQEADAVNAGADKGDDDVLVLITLVHVNSLNVDWFFGK